MERGAQITLIASPSWEPVARRMAHIFLSAEDRRLLPLFVGQKLSVNPFSHKDPFDVAILFLGRSDPELEAGFGLIARKVIRIQGRPRERDPGLASDAGHAGASSAEKSRLAAGKENIRDFLYEQLAGHLELPTRPLNTWPVPGTERESGGNSQTAISRSGSQHTTIHGPQGPVGAQSMTPSQPGLSISHAGSALIHAGSGSSSKNWPLQNYLDAVHYLMLQEVPLRCALWTVGPADSAILEALQSHLPGVQVLRSGEQWNEWQQSKQLREWQNDKAENSKTTQHAILQMELRELMDVIPRCSLFLGNDSGIVHLAAAMGLPGLAIFGASNPFLWAPEGPALSHVRVIFGLQGEQSLPTGDGEAGSPVQSISFPARPDVCELAGWLWSRSIRQGGSHGASGALSPD